MRWGLVGLILASAIAQSQAVYNYFPPPGITYSQANGMVLGSAAGGGFCAGCLNAQGLYINGVPVGSSSGSVTSVSVVSANGLSGTVANPTTTPAITLAPTFSGIVYSTGSGFQAAIAANFPTLNQNTTGNAATATLASTATALASAPTLCSSGQAAQGILANGNATGCITPYSVVNENAGTFFAGPCTGTAALPSFRVLCVNDLPLSSAITWTGNTTFSPTSGVGVTINGASGSDALDINNAASHWTSIFGSSTTSDSDGLLIEAGTNSSDYALDVVNRADSVVLLQVRGDGAVTANGVVTLGGTADLSGTTNISNTANISATTTVSGSLTLSGTTTASSSQAPTGIGYMGVPPYNSCSSGCTLALAQRGETVWASSGTVTVPASTFVQGDTITVVAYGGNVSIAAGIGLTLYWANGTTGSTGTRTLNNVGIATILFESASVALITGSGVS